MKFILTWDVDDFSECGGGEHYEEIQTIEEVYKKIEELSKKETLCFGKLYTVISSAPIVPVEVVTKYKIGECDK